MTPNGVLQILLFCGVLLVTVKPLGAYLARVFGGEHTLLSRVLGPVERGLYRVLGVRPDENMRWTTYAFSLLAFSIVGLFFPTFCCGFKACCHSTRKVSAQTK